MFHTEDECMPLETFKVSLLKEPTNKDLSIPNNDPDINTNTI